MNQCSNCGASINAGTRFCRLCSADPSLLHAFLSISSTAPTVPSRVCQNCGTPLVGAAQFYSHCVTPASMASHPNMNSGYIGGPSRNRVRVIVGTIILAILPIGGSVALARKVDDSAQGATTKKSIDLSTREQAIRTIHQALLNDDKETFRKCITKRILKIVSSRFDSWYKVWRRQAKEMPVEDWLNPRLMNIANEDGNWKLNER